MSKFLEQLENRRTIYHLGKNINQSKEELNSLILKSVELSPSAFNSQSSRVVILWSEHSNTVWNIAKEELKKLMPEDAFKSTSDKLDSFASGVGTILFFEDTDVIFNLQEQFALYADNFPIWSEQSSGMAQLSVWTALSEAGVGASLQHYNPLIDEKVKQNFDIPDSWKLRAQMPFGSIEQPAGGKTFIPQSERFKIFE